MLLGAILAALLLLSGVHWWVTTNQSRSQAQAVTTLTTTLLEALLREAPQDEQLRVQISDLRRRSEELESNFELLKAEVRGQFNKVHAAEQRIRRMLQSMEGEVDVAPVEDLPPWELAARAAEQPFVPEERPAGNAQPPSGAMLSYISRRRK